MPTPDKEYLEEIPRETPMGINSRNTRKIFSTPLAQTTRWNS